MLSKLAWRNVKRQLGNYLIYFMTVAFTVAMLFAVNNIIFSENLTVFTSGSSERQGMLLGLVVLISAIVAFVLSYATSFMLKLRKREFGTYLTLGMTRKNILAIFISETTIICLVALGIGLALGLFIYQGLAAVMMSLLEMEFALADYSPRGLALTVGLIQGIFLLASLTSALYLRRVSIYDLIHGDKKVSKGVKHPTLWFGVTLVSLCLMVGSVIFFDRGIEEAVLRGSSASGTMLALLVFAVAVILFHIGLARGLIYVLLKRRGLCSRGTNTFVFRQLSGTLGSNSVMLGFLAFLLTFAVIGSNVSFVQKAGQEAQLDRAVPYDVVYTSNLNFEEETAEGAEDGLAGEADESLAGEADESSVGEADGGLAGEPEGILPDEAEAVIEKYVGIKGQYAYRLYTSGQNDFYSRTRWQGDGYGGLVDSYMKLSDFNALIGPLGYEEVTLENQYMVIANIPEVEALDWEDFVYSRNGVDYTFHSATGDYPMFSYVFFYVVIPDEAVEGMRPEVSYVVFDTEDGEYDAVSLKKELTYLTPSDYYDDGTMIERCDYTLREYSRQQENHISAILVVGALFVAVVFLFMAMAILALKTLSTLAEDRRRYQVLSRLGAGVREQRRTLFRQTFSFFLLPFAVPLLVSIPTAYISGHIMRLSGMEALAGQVPVIAGVTAAVMAVMYLLYYTAAYLIARRAVVDGR